MDEDLIVLGAPAETQAAGGEDSRATDTPTEGQTVEVEGHVATPGEEQAESAETPAPKAEAPKGDAEGEGEAEKPKKRTGIHRMQDRIARLEAENASLRSAPAGAGGDRGAALEKLIGAPPKEADFNDYVAFEDAKADYRTKKALAEMRLTDQESAETSRQAAAREEVREAFNDRLDEAREKLPDFDKVLAAAKGREVKPHVTDLIVESEKGGLLAYYLAKTPGKLDELNRMSPLQAAKAVGALEHRLTLATPKKAPSAPAPAKPVAGAASPKSPDAEIDAWLAKTYGGRTAR